MGRGTVNIEITLSPGPLLVGLKVELAVSPKILA